MTDKIKWLAEQATEWVSDKIIDRDAADKILARYDGGVATKVDHSHISLALCYVAALLIGAGVIMLVSWNWDIDKPVKTALAIAPWLLSSLLLLGMRYSASAEAKDSWWEFAAVIHILSTGASLILIALLYPSGGEFGRLILLWLVLQYPLLYLTRSVGAWLIWLALALAWAIFTPGASEYWWVVLATLPFLYFFREECADWTLPLYLALLIFRPDALIHGYDYVELILSFVFLVPWLYLFYQSTSRVFPTLCLVVVAFSAFCYPIKFDFGMRFVSTTFETVFLWAVLFLCLPKAFIRMEKFTRVESDQPGIYLLAWLAAASVLMLSYIIGKSYIFGWFSYLLFATLIVGLTQHSRLLHYLRGHTLSIEPLTKYGLIGVGILCFSLGFPGIWSSEINSEIDNFDLFKRATFFDVFFFIILLAVWLGVAGHYIKERNYRLLTVNIVPLLFLLALVFNYYLTESAATTLFTVYFILVFVIVTIYEGVHRLNSLIMNLGFLNLIVLILSRLLVDEIDILDTALAFVLVGLATIAFNVWLAKKAKANTTDRQTI